MSEMNMHDASGRPDDSRPEVGIETPEADAVEQHQPVADQDGDEVPPTPSDADEADAAEQQREVDLDEDDYR